MLHSQLRAAVIKNSHYAFLCFYGVGEGRQCYLEVESQALDMLSIRKEFREKNYV